MRTLSAKMTAHLAGRDHCRAWMLRLDLKDGTVIGLTSWGEDIPFDLGDGAGSITYEARTGAKVSDVDLVIGLSPSNFEVEGPLTEELITHAGIAGGRFNRAEARLFQVNPRYPAWSAIKVMLSHVTEARPEAGKFFLECRSEQDKFNQTVGETIGPMCKADYGDARCGATVEELAITVASVTDELTFTATFLGSAADDFFNQGTIEVLTGDNAGTIGEVHLWTAAGQVTLYAPLAAELAVGDTATLKRGCPKDRTACMARGRMKFFRGEPDVPGTEKIMRAAIPGQGSNAS